MILLQIVGVRQEEIRHCRWPSFALTSNASISPGLIWIFAMRQFVGLSLLLAATMLFVLAPRVLPADQKVDLETLFKTLDLNSDGFVTLKEFQTFDGMGRIKVVTNKDKDKEKDAKIRAEIFKKLDTNKDGKLSLEEFKKISDIIDEYALNKKKK